MKRLFLYLVLCAIFVIISSAPDLCTTTPTPPSGNDGERKCPCTASQIWLDIILVLDVSASMSQEGLAFAEGALATIFGELTVAQTLKQTSRVAIIPFSTNASVYADLNKYNDVNELMNELFEIPLQGDNDVNLLAYPEVMKRLFLYLVLCAIFVIISSAPDLCTTTPTPPSGNDGERKCPCTASQIWLDIILVLDVSASMSQEGLAFAEGALATIFGELTVAQTLKQTSRVAIIPFSTNASVYADLNKYNDVNELMNELFEIPLQGDNDVNLLAGLQAAEDLLQDTAKIKNRKSVVIVFTSAYRTGGYGDPQTIASQIKEDGHTLMTVAYVQNGLSGDDVSKIGALASPGYGFNSSDSNFTGNVIQGFCQTNCFCRDNWIQYSSDFKTTGTRYGECLRFATADASWFAASQVCPATAPGAYLAAEFSKEKHKFNNDYARSVWDKRGTPNYFVGLSYQSALGGYAWQQSKGQPLVPLNTNGYTAWGAGYPDNSGGKNCVKVVQYGFTATWQNVNCYAESTRYICQVNTCDTDNYCEDVN
ncbi:CLEC-62 protein [Aphelenchoides avenae]|nr:CLEC-62 protein [Aphelenchus avenae]